MLRTSRTACAALVSLAALCPAAFAAATDVVDPLEGLEDAGLDPTDGFDVRALLVPADELAAGYAPDDASAPRAFAAGVPIRDSDLRAYDTAIRRQTSTDCQTHATVAGMENLARRKGHTYDLSERTLWSWADNTHYVSEAMRTASRYYVPQEGGRAGKAKISAWDDVATTLGHPAAEKMATTLARAVSAELAAGHPVVIGTKTNASLLNFNSELVINPAAAFTDGGHAMLVVAIKKTAAPEHGGGYYVVKNSWGPRWREGGYGRIPFSYCDHARSQGNFCSFTAVRGVTLQ